MKVVVLKPYPGQPVQPTGNLETGAIARWIVTNKVLGRQHWAKISLAGQHLGKMVGRPNRDGTWGEVGRREWQLVRQVVGNMVAGIEG